MDQSTNALLTLFSTTDSKNGPIRKTGIFSSMLEAVKSDLHAPPSMRNKNLIIMQVVGILAEKTKCGGASTKSENYSLKILIFFQKHLSFLMITCTSKIHVK